MSNPLHSLPIAKSPSLRRDPLLAAYHTWSNADFSQCLAEIAQVRPQLSSNDRDAARALEARCLLRLDRPAEALEALSFAEGSPTSVDNRCTQASLRGLATLSSGRDGAGVELLRDAVSLADVHCASEPVRSETTFNLALGQWMRGNYDTAEELAAANVRTATDVIAARSTALRGWIRIARAEFSAALGFFRSALDVYASCTARDAAFHASVVHALATYDLLLLDRAQSLAYVPMLPRVPGSSLDTYRLLVACVDAVRFALAGDEAAAIESAVSTEVLDVDARWRVFGMALRARVARAFRGEHYARASARAAAALAADVDWSTAPAESRFALLDVGEVLSQYDCDRARSMLAMYARIESKLGPRYLAAAAPVARARELHAKGIVALASGAQSGWEMLVEAATEYAALEFHWRAAESRLALGSVADPAAANAKALGRAFVLERFPASHLARELPDFTPQIVVDPSLPLTPAQWEIAKHLCAGRSTREIATMRGTSLGTIYNQLKDIYRRTDLRSIRDIAERFGASRHGQQAGGPL